MGMAAMSSTQSKCVDVGDDTRRSISSFCDGGGMLFCGCGSSTRGVGAVGTCGVDVVDTDDVVGMGGPCCGVCGWGEVGTACWGSFLGCGGQWGIGLAVSCLCLPLFDGLLSWAIAGACFEMAGMR